MQEGRPHNATVRYWIQSRDTGIYVLSKIKFCYHDVSDTKAFRLAKTIVHENYLLCRFIDEDGKRLFHDYSKKTLKDHVADLAKRKVGILPVMVYKPNVNLLPENQSISTKLYFVPEEFRRLVKDVIGFVLYLHSRNLSFVAGNSQSLTENFKVVGNSLKFWKVGFRASTNRTKMEDYRLIHGVVLELFSGYESQLPIDMCNLVECLKKYSNDVGSVYSDKRVIQHDFAILSHRERTLRIRRFAEMRKFLKGFKLQQYKHAVLSFSISFDDWAEHFAGVVKYILVEECFKHQMEKAKDKKADDEEADDEEAGDEEAENEEICAKDEAHEYYCMNVKHLLFARNLSVHMPDYFFQRGKYLEVTDKDMDCMIFHSCGEILSEFQKNLHDDVKKDFSTTWIK